MCLDARDGKELWRRTTSTYRASVILGEMALMGGFQILGLADGKLVRAVACPAGGPDGAVSPDGKLLVAGSDKGSLTAAGLDDGKVRWSFPPRGGKLSFSGAAISGGHVWFAAGDGLVRAVSLADGKESWSFRLGCRGTAPIVGGNALFIAGEDGCVYALAAGK
jgi:outer membrane protein assembly factor BamB